MIDIHSHILWGLDDGAKTFDESVEMVKLAASTGTTDIVATPHANTEFSFQSAVIQQRIHELHAATGHALRIHAGCDFHLDFDNLQDALAHPQKYTINQKRYLLVEFDDLLLAKSSGEILERLHGHGMIPIITHPERNRYLQRHMNEIEPWVERGCLVQVTGQSYLGHFGHTAQSCTEKLLDKKLVHFFASDGHDLEHRPPRLDKAYEQLARHYGKERAQQLCIENPKRVIDGEPWPEPRHHSRREKKRGWWPF